MAEKTLTIGELKALLKGLPADTPLYLQDVRTGGVTYRFPIWAAEGDPADGKLVWIWVRGAAESPQWMASGAQPIQQSVDIISQDAEIQAINAILTTLRHVPSFVTPSGGPAALRVIDYVRARVAHDLELGKPL